MIKTIPLLCGSVAGQPSALGVKLHNAAYRATGKDATYLAMGAETIDVVFDIAKELSFRGLAVSMPFKQSVIPLLDSVSQDVHDIGACNTVVFDDGRATGHNTDWRGALAAIDEVTHDRPTSALLVGAGGVSRAIAYGLNLRQVKVLVAARRVEQAQKLVADLKLEAALSIADASRISADLVVNCTPESGKDAPISDSMLAGGSILFDVAFGHRTTPLMRRGSEVGLKVVAGWRMLLLQACGQYELYFNETAPLAEMSDVLEQALPE